MADSDAFNDFEYWKMPSDTNNGDNDLTLDETAANKRQKSGGDIIDFLYYENKFNKQFNNINNEDENENNIIKLLNSPTLSYVSIDVSFNNKQHEDFLLENRNCLLQTATPTNSNPGTTPTMTSNNSNIITSTRFLHLNNTTNSTFSKKINSLAANDDLICDFDNVLSPPQQPTIMGTIKLDSLISLTPLVQPISNSTAESVNNNNGGGVVSRIKNWMGIRKIVNNPTTPVTVASTAQTNDYDISSEASSSTSSFKLNKLFLHQPSSDSTTTDNQSSATSSTTNITNKTPSELLLLNNNLDIFNNIEKKLKRPTNIPNNIEYNNDQVFQGT